MRLMSCVSVCGPVLYPCILVHQTFTVGLDGNATAFRKAYKRNPVIPAQAGIHREYPVALCYGFPPSRERQWWFVIYTKA